MNVSLWGIFFFVDAVVTLSESRKAGRASLDGGTAGNIVGKQREDHIAELKRRKLAIWI